MEKIVKSDIRNFENNIFKNEAGGYNSCHCYSAVSKLNSQNAPQFSKCL